MQKKQTIDKAISIVDKDYLIWIKELASRYRSSQIKAAVKVNQEMLRFYWELGRDIMQRNAENRYGGKFYATLSVDLKHEMPDVTGLSETSIRYAKRFYELYSPLLQKFPQLGEKFTNDLFSIPWGHHKYIKETSGLAQELTRDPYNFAFTGITGKYNETILKNALLKNITDFLVELGTGFAYVGREYHLQIGQKEKFIDLLFYNLNLSCYVVIEVKIGEFDFPDMGQLSGYVTACNHLLRKEGRDNPTIGLLICKQKDNLLAQYALEGCNQPVGISEYELAKLYPEKIEGTIPTVEEIEIKLSEMKIEDKKD